MEVIELGLRSTHPLPHLTWIYGFCFARPLNQHHNTNLMMIELAVHHERCAKEKNPE